MKSPVVRTPRDKPTVDDLDGRIGDLDKDMVALRVFLNQAADGDHDNLVDAARDVAAKVEELEAENADLRTRLDRLGDIGQEKTSKEQKIAAVVTYADQERDDKSKHTLSIKNIKGAAGVSRRYAYTLAQDHMIDEFDWALDPADVPQYGSLEVDKGDATAGVTIDFEELHSNPEAVNKFITPSAAQGVAD